MIVYEKKEYPDEFEILINLIQKMTTLKKEQLVIYLLQINDQLVREEAEKIINQLIESHMIEVKNDLVGMPGRIKENPTVILAFWLFLSYVQKDTVFERANYPAEIIFKEGDCISEIIVCNNDLELRLDYIEKRKKRKNRCKFYFLFEEEIIDDFDDDYFPKDEFVLITTSTYGQDVPTFFYHDTKIDD